MVCFLYLPINPCNQCVIHFNVGAIIEVDTVLEGSTVNFTCTVKAFPGCTVLWRIFDFETGLTQFKPSSERTDIGNNKFKSTLRIEAVNRSVIQCESYKQHSADKKYYSKFVVVDVHQRQMSTSIATQGPVITSTPAPVSSSQVVTSSSPPVSSSQAVNPTPVDSVENSDFKMNSAGIYAVLLSSFVTLYL